MVSQASVMRRFSFPQATWLCPDPLVVTQTSAEPLKLIFVPGRAAGLDPLVVSQASSTAGSTGPRNPGRFS